MPSENVNLLMCYNRGCGNKFDPNDNKEDSCTFHPGNPVFHDAYKGWSCCNKKCTDFTEFLNIKGCTKSCHSNVKPPEPEKPVVDKSKANEVIEYKAPLLRTKTLERPPFDTPLTTMRPEVSSQLRSQMESLSVDSKEINSSSVIQIGTTCKNGGCKSTYEGPESNDNCVYHPGSAVFHEGLKFWSCCTKRTTSFTAFLNQVGCQNGSHVWIKEKNESSQTDCRIDWHQTGSYVVMSIYAKKYDFNKSSVQLNPIRAKISLLFPENKTTFDKDIELFGVVDVSKSEVGMFPTKVEIKLRKAEPGSWSKLEISNSQKPVPPPNKNMKPPVKKNDSNESEDLSDIY